MPAELRRKWRLFGPLTAQLRHAGEFTLCSSPAALRYLFLRLSDTLFHVKPFRTGR